MDAKDHLLNGSIKTALGKVGGYAYLLEVDNNTDNALDTVGIFFEGKAGDEKLAWLYSVEFATQESETLGGDFEAEYLKLEAGVALPRITAQLGYEVLGSDDGNYGFSTPLATLHKFNGWADLFLGTPSTGLVDTYLSLGGGLGAGKLALVYHMFSADESTATLDDYGDELDLSYSFTFAKQYNAGIKYAAYSADDLSVDTDKLWFWVGTSF